MKNLLKVISLNQEIFIPFYHHLMNYRIEIYRILNFNSGVLEASSLGFRKAISLTSELNKDLFDKIEIIDKLLFEIINPEKLEFDENTLIKEYNFPKDDLDEIEYGKLVMWFI